MPRPRPLLDWYLLQWLLLLAVLAAGRPAQASGPTSYLVEGQEKPVALLASGAATYLITEHSVLELKGRQFVRRYRSEVLIRCALALPDTALWLGTQRGAVRLNTRQFGVRRVALPSPAAAAPIAGLCRDAAGAVWLGAVGYGVFRLAGHEVENRLSAPSVSALLATADSSVWIGSSLGLDRFQHQQWTRYNEEGVANFEIPDNIVEKLLPDNAGNLWVLMSAGISVFPGGGGPTPLAPTELPTATFIGRPGNEVFSVAYLPGLGRVFATAMGPLLLPDAPAGPFVSFEPASTDKVEPKQLLVPLNLPGAGQPRLVQLDARQRVWVVSTGQVQVWRGPDFRRLAQRR